MVVPAGHTTFTLKPSQELDAHEAREANTTTTQVKTRRAIQGTRGTPEVPSTLCSSIITYGTCG